MPRRKRERDPHQEWLQGLHPALRMLAEWPHWANLSGGTLVVACSGGRDSVALAHAAWTLLKGPEAEAFAAYVTARIASVSSEETLSGARARLHEDDSSIGIGEFEEEDVDLSGIRLVLWHYDHGLRNDSGADALFVQQMGDRLGLRTEVICGRLTEHPEFGRRNTADLARGCRYAALGGLISSETYRDQDYNFVAGLLAHHQQDQAETVLHNLVRGTGLRGLRGMTELNIDAGSLLHRPWLALEPDQIQDYCKVNQLSWRDDPTNISLKSTRSRIRNEVLPLLRAINTDAVRHIADLSADAQEIRNHLETSLPHPSPQLLTHHRLPLFAKPHTYVFFRLPEDLEPGTVAQWYALEPALHHWTALRRRDIGRFRSWIVDPEGILDACGVRFSSGRGLLAIEPADKTSYQLYARIVGDTRPPPNVPLPVVMDSREGITLPVTSADCFAWIEYQQDTGSDQLESYRIEDWWEHLGSEYKAYARTRRGNPVEWPVYSCDLIGEAQHPLRLRHPKVGDRIQLSSGSHKKLSDVFIDAKIPRRLRPIWMVLVNGLDEVLWVPGLADSRRMHVAKGRDPRHRITLRPYLPLNQRLQEMKSRFEDMTS